jgi:mannose-6-phosphate isomerase-like protein (cupin superfamily)
MSTMQKPKVARVTDCDAISLLGDIYTILVTGEESGGKYAWAEAVVGPGNGVPPHLHTREDESFYILEGQLDFMVDGREVAVSAGTILHVPLGTVHAYKNNSGKPAKYLVQTVPSGFEKMLAECGQPVPAGTSPIAPREEDIQRLLSVAPKYGIEILPPPET